MKPEDSSAIAQRCRLLRIAVSGDGYGSQAAFTQKIGLPNAKNWNNYEREVGRPQSGCRHSTHKPVRDQSRLDLSRD
jgi:hypothetical protein